MLIKVCGLREPENVLRVSQIEGVSLCGFIFYQLSPRYVGAAWRGAATAPGVQRVGVFVDASNEEIWAAARKYDLDWVQLHGCESPAQVRELRGGAGGGAAQGVGRLKIIKALSVATEADLDRAADYDADLLLFDTKCAGHGGSGAKFDWDILRNYKGATDFLLSGGIGPDDAISLKNFRHPRLAGYDLNSRFELEPGLKDIDKLKKFINEQD